MEYPCGLYVVEMLIVLLILLPENPNIYTKIHDKKGKNPFMLRSSPIMASTLDYPSC
jgi:hypothetical protein